MITRYDVKPCRLSLQFTTASVHQYDDEEHNRPDPADDRQNNVQTPHTFILADKVLSAEWRVLS